MNGAPHAGGGSPVATAAVSPLDDADAIRIETVTLLDSTADAGRRTGLPAPEPPGGLDAARARLAADSFDVLVVGEAKRGKSTLINALVGRDVLPTDVAVATSQVFRVSTADREAYRLRFEDGSTREITADDLDRYGSEVFEGGERPRLDQILRWIEVDVPGIRFLPRGTALLDTPGLGALYGRHQEITQRMIPLADATVFVLDSERPVMATELEAVGTILTSAPDVFFVQTKTDLFGEPQWRSIRERNEEILRERFPALGDVVVWPLSSRLLRGARDDTDDARENLEDSGHQEFELALRRFLLVAVGWRRTAAALAGLEQHHMNARGVLITRLEALRAESQQQREAVQGRLARWREAFAQDWGPQGGRHLAVMKEIRTTVDAARRGVRQALAPHGPILTGLRKEIDAVGTVKELERLNEALPARLVAEVGAHQQQVMATLEERITAALAPLLDEGARRWAGPEVGVAAVEIESHAIREVKGQRWEKASGAFRNFRLAGSMGGFAVTATAWGTSSAIAAGALTAATGGAALAVVGVVALAGTAWTTFHGWRQSGRNRVHGTRGDVTRNLDACAGALRARLFEDDFTSGEPGAADAVLAATESAALDYERSTVARKNDEAKAEYERMRESARLDDQERLRRIADADADLARWDALAGARRALDARLDALLESTLPAGVGGAGS